MRGQGVVTLTLGGAISAAIAGLHVVIVFIGAPGYRYFGAGEALARQAELGSPVPAGITVVIATAFGVFAAYGLAGAKVIGRLPLLRAGLVSISAVYLSRGVSAVPHGAAMLASPSSFPTRYFVFSCVALVAGYLYALGTLRAWRHLGRQARAV